MSDADGDKLLAELLNDFEDEQAGKCVWAATEQARLFPLWKPRDVTCVLDNFNPSWLGGGSTIDGWSYPPEPTPEEKTTLELKNRFFGGCTGECDDRLRIHRKKEFRGQKDNTIRVRVKNGACSHTPAENPHPLCFYLALRAGFCTEGNVLEFLLKTNQVICCVCFVQFNLPSFKLPCDVLLLFRSCFPPVTRTRP